MDHLERLKNDKHVMSEIEALKWDDWERNTIYQDGIKIGIERGIEQGIEQGMQKKLIDMIKKLLQKNYSIDEIKDITDQSIEYILKIKETM